MEKLKLLGVVVHRTDECGTVVVTSDGKTISFNVKLGDYTGGSSGNNSTLSTSLSKTSFSDSNQRYHTAITEK